MNLVIDIGNTRIKLAVFRNGELLFEDILKEEHEIGIHCLFNQYHEINYAIISSVKQEYPSLFSLLKKKEIQIYAFGKETRIPFPIKYKTPGSLGKDRIAAIAGACVLYPHRDLLVIDAGTALTIDLYTLAEGYLGGNISPGMRMRFNALNKFTDQLPLILPNTDFEFIGQSTTDAIRSGVQNGLIFEIEGYLTKISEKYPQIAVILTGGDAQFFDNKLKKSIFVVQNLTLVGLNFILDYNAKTS